MATGTVKELDGKRQREDVRDEARRELRASMTRFPMAEMACSGSGRSHVALLGRSAARLARQHDADVASQPFKGGLHRRRRLATW